MVKKEHKETVQVICPVCRNIIKGEIKAYENVPFNSYYAECPYCLYKITESEWEEVRCGTLRLM